MGRPDGPSSATVGRSCPHDDVREQRSIRFIAFDEVSIASTPL